MFPLHTASGRDSAPGSWAPTLYLPLLIQPPPCLLFLKAELLGDAGGPGVSSSSSHGLFVFFFSFDPKTFPPFSLVFSF